MFKPFLPEHTQAALEKINGISDLLNEWGFYLAGGTALAFTLKYRVSYDLDFFTPKHFDANNLISRLSSTLDVTGIYVEEGTVKFTLLDTQISFFYYPYPLLYNLESLNFNNFAYSIKIANIVDISLMKVTAIAGRGLQKDFADLYYAANTFGGLAKILDLFKQKYLNTDFEHYLKSLLYFEDANNGPIPNVIVEDYDWNKIKLYYQSQIKEYFEKLQVN